MASNRPNWPGTRVAAPEAPNLRQLSSLITSVVVICGLYLGREVLMPVTLAVLLSFLVAPLVDQLRRLRLGKLPSVLIAAVLSLAVMGGIGTLIGAQVAQLGADLPRYQAAIETKIQRVQGMTVGRVDDLLASASNFFKRATPVPKPGTTTGPGAPKQQDRLPIPVAVQEPAPTPFALAQRFLSPVISPLETAGIVLVVAIFILLQREDLRDRLIGLFGSRDLHRATIAMDEAAHRLSRYFLAQFGVNVGVGIVISIGLAIIGVPGAVLFGVLTALLRFVPYVGIWIGALLALTLAAAGPDWSMLLWTIALFAAADLITAQVVEPFLYGHSTGLSPVAVLVAAIFWSWIWGPVGLVLSTPLTLCLVILGRHVDKLGFLEVLLGDRPPLSPPANFYQRILADDPEGALEQAETLLKDMVLVDYYDSVMLAGLQLAQNDIVRGVIPPEQLLRIKEALLDILDGLEDIDEPAKEENLLPAGHDEPSLRSPAAPGPATVPGQAGSAVVCIAGRGGLDELLAAATVQLLAREGIQADLADYAQFSRKRLAETNLSGVSTICVVSLEAEQSSAHLRILLRRLHERGPKAKLIFGFLPDTPQDTQEHSGTVSLAVSSFNHLIALARPGSEPDTALQASAKSGGGTRLAPAAVESGSLSPDSI